MSENYAKLKILFAPELSHVPSGASSHRQHPHAPVPPTHHSGMPVATGHPMMNGMAGPAHHGPAGAPMTGGGGLHQQQQQQQQWQMMMNNTNHLKRDREDDVSLDDPRNPAKRIDTGVGKGGVPGFASPMGAAGLSAPGYGGMPVQNTHGMSIQMLPPGAAPGVDQHQQQPGQQQPHPSATPFPGVGVPNPQMGGVASPVSRPSPTHHNSNGSLVNGMVPTQSSPLASVPPATPQQAAAGIPTQHQQHPSQQQPGMGPANLSGDAIHMQLRARHAHAQMMQQQQHLRQQQQPHQQQSGGQPGVPGSNPPLPGAMNGGMNIPAVPGGTLLGGPSSMPGLQQPPLTPQQSQAVLAQAVQAVKQGPSNTLVQHLMKSNPQFLSLSVQSQVQAVSALQVWVYFTLLWGLAPFGNPVLTTFLVDINESTMECE